MKTPFASLSLLLLFIANFNILNAKTLDETAWQILKESPQFKSENYSLESMISTLKTESNLPDPELSGEYLVMPQDVDNRWTAQVEWGVEWPGVYGARSKEAKTKMTSAEKQLMTQRADRLAEIKDLLLDYIQCRQKLALLEELNNNNDTIYRLAEQAAKGGEMTVLDLNKVKLEYANIRGAKAALLDEEASVVANLSQIYGTNCEAVLQELTPEFPPVLLPSEEEIMKIKEVAPSVQLAYSEAETARRAQKVSKMEALPSLTVGYKHQFEDGMHFNGAVLGISIPMFSSRGKQKAAKAEILDAEFRAEVAGMEIEAEAVQNWKRLRLLNEQIQEIAPLVENADYNAALLKAYRGGVLTLIEYISDRNYFTNAAVELVSLRLAAAKAQAQLQKYLIDIE